MSVFFYLFLKCIKPLNILKITSEIIVNAAKPLMHCCCTELYSVNRPDCTVITTKDDVNSIIQDIAVTINPAV